MMILNMKDVENTILKLVDELTQDSTAFELDEDYRNIVQEIRGMYLLMQRLGNAPVSDNMNDD